MFSVCLDPFCVASNNVAIRNNAASSPGRATSCNPTGKPSPAKPHGSEIAGWPVRLNGIVYGYHAARRFGTSRPSIPIGPKKS